MPYSLTPEQLDEFGREMDEIRQRVMDDLGQADADYLRSVIKAQRAFEGAGRALSGGCLARLAHPGGSTTPCARRSRARPGRDAPPPWLSRGPRPSCVRSPPRP